MEREIVPMLSQVFQEMGWSSVKPEQKEVVEAILKTDVFVILPTGFGKSACYQCLPLLHKKLYPGSDSAIIVVVSPLKALIKDQASCIVVFLSNLFYSAPNVTGISTPQ